MSGREGHAASPRSDRCVICRSTNLTSLIEIERVPVVCNRLYDTRDEAMAAPQGPLRLVACGDCGHLFNAAFEPALVNYDEGYENSLHHSPRFHAYAEALAERLVRTHRLSGHRVTEVGCGQGEFLGLLCAAGAGEGVGFDPAFRPATSDALPDRVRIFGGHFDAGSDVEPSALFCCRHVLEHVPLPVAFLQAMHLTMESSPDAAVYVEVPNALYTLRDLGIWDLLYEHCSYFSPRSLVRTMEMAGFVVDDVVEDFGGQFLGVDARSKNGTAPRVDRRQAEGPFAFTDAFGHRYEERRDSWRHALAEHSRQGHHVVVWGCGTKGVTFLDVVGRAGGIDCVVDINPNKHGRYVPGTGHQVVPPEALVHRPPDVVLLMNPIYENEVAAELDALGLSPTIRCV